MRSIISIGLLSLFLVYSYHTLYRPPSEQIVATDNDQEEGSGGAFDWINDFVKGLGDEVQRTMKDLRLELFATLIQQDQTEELYKSGFGYQEILKLHIISQITNKEIDEILAIDNAVIIEEDGEKRVNMYVLIDAFGLSNEDIRNKIRDFAEDLSLYKQEENKKKKG